MKLANSWGHLRQFQPQAEITLSTLEELLERVPKGSLASDLLECASGKLDLRFAYTTPEALANPILSAAIAKCAVARYVVDELHAVDDWGDWRDDFQALGIRLNACDNRRAAIAEANGLPLPPRPAYVGVTGSASPRKLIECSRMIGQLPNTVRVSAEPAAFARANLRIMVMHANADLERSCAYLKTSTRLLACGVMQSSKRLAQLYTPLWICAVPSMMTQQGSSTCARGVTHR